jgi:Domain of unknown function (DUF4265)
MSHVVPMTLILDGDDQAIVQFPEEDLSVSVPITRVGEDLYRLDAVPVCVEGAGFRDIVEAHWVSEGTLRVCRVAQRSGWRTYDFIVPPWKIDTEDGRALLLRLEELGGYWERVLGGLLLVCIPPGLDLDPTEWVKAFGSIACL